MENGYSCLSTLKSGWLTEKLLKVLGIPPGLKKKFPRVMSTACPARTGVPRAVLAQKGQKNQCPGRNVWCVGLTGTVRAGA